MPAVTAGRDEGLMETSAPGDRVGCPICREPARRLRPFARRGDEAVHLMRCGGCACEFLDPQPSGAWLAEEYAGYYVRRDAGVERPKRRYFETLLRGTRIRFQGLRVLEIGAGEGDCAAALSGLWPDAAVTAVESNPECRPHYASLRCTLVNQGVEEWIAGTAAGSFDAVLLFDLLEHLRDPLRSLGSLLRKDLVPGGWIVATFPRADSLSRRLQGPLWPQYKPEHLFYFSRGAVLRMGAAVGLETTILRPLVKTLPVGYFLSVGSGFGPPAIRRMTSLVRSAVPRGLNALQVPLRLGEWLWVARRRKV